MSTQHSRPESELADVAGWIISGVFVAIGVLNIIFVHPVPGTVYVALSLIYVPSVNAWIKRRFGFSVPRIVKIIIGFIAIWGTLAVSDLAELAGL